MCEEFYEPEILAGRVYITVASVEFYDFISDGYYERRQEPKIKEIIFNGFTDIDLYKSLRYTTIDFKVDTNVDSFVYTLMLDLDFTGEPLLIELNDFVYRDYFTHDNNFWFRTGVCDDDMYTEIVIIVNIDYL